MKRILLFFLLATFIASAQTAKNRATVTRERHEPQKTIVVDSTHQSNKKNTETVKREPQKQEPPKPIVVDSKQQSNKKNTETVKQEPPKTVVAGSTQQTKKRVRTAPVKQEPKQTNAVSSEQQKQTVNKSPSIKEPKQQAPVVVNYVQPNYTQPQQRVVVLPSMASQQTIFIHSEQQEQIVSESPYADDEEYEEYEEEEEPQEIVATDHPQAKQRVAVLPSVGELDPQRMNLLTDKIREIVTQTLPTDKFALLRQDALIEMIGEEDYFIACKEGTCIGELAKKANANYGMRCDILKIDDLFVLKFELYSVENEETLEIFTDYNAKDFFEMIAVLEERLPDAFKKIIDLQM